MEYCYRGVLLSWSISVTVGELFEEVTIKVLDIQSIITRLLSQLLLRCSGLFDMMNVISIDIALRIG